MEWGSLPELVGPRHAYRVARLAALLARAVPRGHVLDAGCGPGTLTERLARVGYHVTAVDASAAFVEHVQRGIAQAGLSDRVAVQQLDLAAGSLPEARFDGAVCGEVLEHVPDDASAVRGLAAALKPGGALVISVPAGASDYDWLDRWAGHERRYDEADVRALLRGAGLEVETLIRWGFPFMMLYERFVQRPGLARASGGLRGGSALARLARYPAVSAAFGVLFTADHLFEGRLARGTGFFAVARKPA